MRWSAEELDSVPESEGPLSSVIRLPAAKSPTGDAQKRQQTAPPPLPPKPAFARGTSLASPGPPPPLPPKPNISDLSVGPPPPLPPKPAGGLHGLGLAPPLPSKPENRQGEVLVDLSQKRPNAATSSLNRDGPELLEHSHNPSALLPPTRPVPAVPKSDRKPSYGEDGSWVPSCLDDRSQPDPPQPPEPTIISEGEPIRSSLGNLDASTLSLSDQIPNLTLPLPPPPYTAQNRRISSFFPPIPKSEDPDQELSEKFISLSVEEAEDAHIGAIVLSRDRRKRKHSAAGPRKAPIQWRPYDAQESGGEAWSVLQEYLTNESLKTHGRNRALQLLTGYVVGACLESREAGMGLLSEIVRRMRGAERSERDGSIFTLIVNIAAHASFVQELQWASVENVARCVFSNVVEEMHGRQDDDVMWERALRCYLLLLKSSNSRPSDEISSRCLAALALHIGDLTHTDVDHVLITEGICARLQSPREDRVPAVALDYRCLEEIGGLETVLTLFADTPSLSARHALFRVIYDAATLACLENIPENEVDILRDHIVTFRALFETYEMADCIVHTFRVGPSPNFVMDIMRILLFDPLSSESFDSLTVHGVEERQHNERKVLQEKTESQSFSDTRLSGTIGRQYRSSASKHTFSTRALVRLLDKPFCLRILQQFEKMASKQAKLLSQRETVHAAREWKITCDIERQLQFFVFGNEKSRGRYVSDIVTKIYVAVVDITSGRANLKSVVQIIEMIIEFFTVKPPFAKRRGVMQTAVVESAARLFLKGQLIVSKALLSYANPSIFTLLLLATRTKVSRCRVSECRQCLVEFLGSKTAAEMLQPFCDDADAHVAYRASELISKYTDINVQGLTPPNAIDET